jgi:hypothetical protein
VPTQEERELIILPVAFQVKTFTAQNIPLRVSHDRLHLFTAIDAYSFSQFEVDVVGLTVKPYSFSEQNQQQETISVATLGPSNNCSTH